MRFVVVLVAAILAAPERARACTCAYRPPTVSPADQATNVPVNAIAIVRFPSGAGATVELRLASTNEVVATSNELHRGPPPQLASTMFARPTLPLQPNTQYLVVANDGAADYVTTFATGTLMDTEPPLFAGLTSMRPETMETPDDACISTCGGGGRISRIHLGFEAPADVVATIFELYDGNEALIDKVPLAVEETYLGFYYCEPRAPVLEPGRSYCGKLVGYDVAGNRAGDNVVCVAAAVCEPKTAATGCDPSPDCESPGCAVGRAQGVWLAALVLLLRRRTKRSCRGGPRGSCRR